MEIGNINSPDDILNFLNCNIKYGWIGVDGSVHENNMDNFRLLYRTSNLIDVLKTGLGTCIEQAFLTKYLLDKINIPSKMFCTRMYEDESFNDLNAPERMHCFILFYIEDKVFRLEHADIENAGIYSYNSEDEAIKTIVSHYEKMTAISYLKNNKEVPVNGFKRTTTEFFDVPSNLSYMEFNIYVNNLDKKKVIK